MKKKKKKHSRAVATIRFKTDGADPTISLLHFKKSTLQLRTRRGGGHCYILFPSEENIYTKIKTLSRGEGRENHRKKNLQP